MSRAGPEAVHESEGDRAPLLVPERSHLTGDHVEEGRPLADLDEGLRPVEPHARAQAAVELDHHAPTEGRAAGFPKVRLPLQVRDLVDRLQVGLGESHPLPLGQRTVRAAEGPDRHLGHAQGFHLGREGAEGVVESVHGSSGSAQEDNLDRGDRPGPAPPSRRYDPAPWASSPAAVARRPPSRSSPSAVASSWTSGRPSARRSRWAWSSTGPRSPPCPRSSGPRARRRPGARWWWTREGPTSGRRSSSSRPGEEPPSSRDRCPSTCPTVAPRR